MRRLENRKMESLVGGKLSTGQCALLGAAVVINFWTAYFYSAEVKECWNS